MFDDFGPEALSRYLDHRIIIESKKKRVAGILVQVTDEKLVIQVSNPKPLLKRFMVKEIDAIIFQPKIK